VSRKIALTSIVVSSFARSRPPRLAELARFERPKRHFSTPIATAHRTKAMHRMRAFTVRVRLARARLAFAFVAFTVVSRASLALASTTEDERAFTITSFTPNERETCFVTPYGWYCTPSSIEYSTTIYDGSETYDGERYDARAEASSSASACGTASAATCGNATVEECAELSFELRRASLRVDTDDALAIAYEWFVNRFNGSDDWLGTREEPWATVERAERRVRFLRVVNEASGRGTKFMRPLQIWVREDVGDDAMKQKQIGNGRYAGISIAE